MRFAFIPLFYHIVWASVDDYSLSEEVSCVLSVSGRTVSDSLPEQSETPPLNPYIENESGTEMLSVHI